MAIASFELTSRTAWLDRLTADFLERLDRCWEAGRPLAVALSGGSTPIPLYQHWAKLDLPWERVLWWIGDERWVPVSDPRSNQGMIRKSLGSEVLRHLRGWHGSEDPAEAAKAYDRLLRQFLGDPPVFDLVLLGVGEDGHTASLFPGTPALEEREAYAVTNPHPGGGPLRLTLTYPCLDVARSVWFLAAGEEKKEIIGRLIAGDSRLPAARIRAVDQRLYWLRGE